jgi:hypothetical protein
MLAITAQTEHIGREFALGIRMQKTAAVASTDDGDKPAPSLGPDDLLPEDETVAMLLTEATSQLATSALKSDAPLNVLGGQLSPLHLRRNSVSDVPTVVEAAVAMPQKHVRLSRARCMRACACVARIFDFSDACKLNPL